MVNYIIGSIILILLVLAIRHIIKRNKTGNCSGCPGCSDKKYCYNKLEIKKLLLHFLTKWGCCTKTFIHNIMF